MGQLSLGPLGIFDSGGNRSSKGVGECWWWGMHLSHLLGFGSPCVHPELWQEPWTWLGLECLQVLEAPASQLQSPHPPNSIAKYLLSALCHLSWFGGAEGNSLYSIPPPNFVKMSLHAQHWWRKCGLLLCSSCHDLKPY